jgi:hypothetical protein
MPRPTMPPVSERSAARAEQTFRWTPAARLYATYAAAFLLVTLASGVWLRAVFVFPGSIGGFRFANALHAHSHVAFFGWTTMALFAVFCASALRRERSPWLRVHAHATGLASAAAFLGFLRNGYDAATITISVIHVGAWVTFAIAAWPALSGLPPVLRRFWRAALALLVVAGAGAMLPGIVMARGMSDPWIYQITIKAFLTPFTSGWLVLGTMGAVYVLVERHTLATWVLRCAVLGVLPSTLLHTAAPPPGEWMTLLGRAGTILVGVSALLFAADVLRSRGKAPLLWVVGIAAALKGGSEVLVGAGVLAELLASRQVTIAYLHLVLLGMVTPALMVAALRIAGAPRLGAAYALGLGAMLLALVGLGWPAVGSLLTSAGLHPGRMFPLALVGGAVCAVAGALLVASRTRWRLPRVLRRGAPGGPPLRIAGAGALR